ncbi:MAG TPA: hypothetical protein VFT69_17060 [Pseudolabrys sp.]|nr:hypothetical protein [Pseudolabrys sp.]
MISAADFPHLSSPLWDRIRIPCRPSFSSVATPLCLDAGFDPEYVRRSQPERKDAPQGLSDLRCRITAAAYDAGLSEHDALQWFVGFEPATVRRWLSRGRKMREVAP